MKINWKVRIKNKLFWLAMVSALALVVQAVLKLFGIEVDLSDKVELVKDLVNAVFGVLVILGVVTDPTTEGIKDSTQAMTYDEPKSDDDYMGVL